MAMNDDYANERDRSHRKAFLHPLSLHLEEISETLKVLPAYPHTEDDLIQAHVEIIQESLLLIKTKLHSALRSNSYLVCVQNAAIIRNHAEYLRLASHTLNSLQSFDREHVAVFRQEMEEFRELFKAWAKEIKKMDKGKHEDEWGLF
jgi:hypothetical protein